MSKTIPRTGDVPVIRDVDVLVAGCGTSGLFAGLAAARHGASVFMVDRLSAPGGNIGPGMLVGYFVGKDTKSFILKDGSFPPCIQDFIDRLNEHLADVPFFYPTMSHAISRVVFEMFDEFGVELMLNAFAADPILDGDRVRGLFIETKSGTVAVRAKVVIDGTGDADVARRAGAPWRAGSPAETVYRPEEIPKSETHITGSTRALKGYNETQLLFYVGDADYWKFRAFCAKPFELSDDDKSWAEAHFLIGQEMWPDSMIPILRRGWESGEFQVQKEIRPGVRVGMNNWFSDYISRPGLIGGRAGIFGDYDTGSWEDVTMADKEVRNMIHDGVNFFRRSQLPGFEQAYLLFISPFMGARGSPFIEGERMIPSGGMRIDESRADAMYRAFIYGMPYIGDPVAPEGFDVPYGMLLPKGIDGLLVTGRGASWERRGHDPTFRERTNMMALGTATGLAAAIAAADGVEPRSIEIGKLQRTMLNEGFYLGNEERLRDLGLVSA